jgi:hypothetical protein
MLLSPWRDFSMTLRLSGSASGGSLDLLVTHRLRRCRLLGGCPTTPQVDSHPSNLGKLTKHHLLSTVHLLSRCSSLRDSRFHLARDKWSRWTLALGVARKATILGSALRIGLHSLLSLQPTLVWSRGLLSGRRYQWAALDKSITPRLRRFYKMSLWWSKCLLLITIQHMCCLILVHHIHSWAWDLHKGTIYILWLFLLPIELALQMRSCALILGWTPSD